MTLSLTVQLHRRTTRAMSMTVFLLHAHLRQLTIQMVVMMALVLPLIRQRVLSMGLGLRRVRLHQQLTMETMETMAAALLQPLILQRTL